MSRLGCGFFVLVLCISLLAGCSLMGIVGGITEDKLTQADPGLVELPTTSSSTEVPTQLVPEALTVDAVIPYIEIYNECENATYGAQYDQSVIYHRVFENPDDLMNDIPPVAVVDETDSRYNNHNDPVYCNVYRVTNFASMAELEANLGIYMTQQMIDGMLYKPFMEYEGVLYYVVGNAGYGSTQVGTYDIRIGEQEEYTCTVYAPTLYFDEYMGEAQLVFRLQDDGSWKLTEVILAEIY